MRTRWGDGAETVVSGMGVGLLQNAFTVCGNARVPFERNHRFISKFWVGIVEHRVFIEMHSCLRVAYSGFHQSKSFSIQNVESPFKPYAMPSPP